MSDYETIKEQYDEIQRLRAMFDATRHRVLSAMGESDMDHRWGWIEMTLAERRRDAEQMGSALGQIGLACRTMRRLRNLDDLPELRELLEEIETQMEGTK